MCFIVHVHGVFWSFHCPRWRLCALKGVSKFVQQTGVKWREILMKFASNKSALVLLRHQCRRSLHQRSCWCWTTRPQQALTAATDLADLSPLHLWNGKSLVKVKLQMISDVSCLEFLYSICRAHFRLFKCWFPLTPAQPKSGMPNLLWALAEKAGARAEKKHVTLPASWAEGFSQRPTKIARILHVLPCSPRAGKLMICPGICGSSCLLWCWPLLPHCKSSKTRACSEAHSLGKWYSQFSKGIMQVQLTSLFFQSPFEILRLVLYCQACSNAGAPIDSTIPTAKWAFWRSAVEIKSKDANQPVPELRT